jgi:hypothetical protein
MTLWGSSKVFFRSAVPLCITSLSSCSSTACLLVYDWRKPLRSRRSKVIQPMMEAHVLWQNACSQSLSVLGVK